MNTKNSIPIWIDTDNALGSPIGDIDDAIAVAAVLKSGYPVTSVSNIFGNTFQPISFKQTQHLLSLFNSQLPHYSGANTWWSKDSEASSALAKVNFPIKILALGPLTNVALALKKNPLLKNFIQEIIFVGTNYTIQLPTWRFFDFNVFKDKNSALFVINSGVPVTLIPCDQARKTRMTFLEVQTISGEPGKFIAKQSKRWFRRAKFFKFQTSIPVWDLTAAMYLLWPDQFELAPAIVTTNLLKHVKVKVVNKKTQIQTVKSFNPLLKNQMLELLQSHRSFLF